MVLALWVVGTQAGVQSPQSARVFSDLVQTLAAVIACGMSLRAAVTTKRHSRSQVRAWVAIGCSTGCWGGGQLVWSWYEMRGDAKIPFPSLADVGYLLALPFMTYALVQFRTTLVRTAARV